MPRNPVVFIPGFPATELIRRSTGKRVFPPSLSVLANSEKKAALVRLLQRPDPPPGELVAGEPIRRVSAVAKQAESLYDILRSRYGYTIDGGDNFRPVGWDWRHAIDDPAVQADIAAAIMSLHASTGQRVIVIVHSTGGLVFRRALEMQPHLAPSIEHVMSFGVPWAGNLKAFRYLTKGESIGPFFAKLTATQTRDVMRYAQAAYDLCPPDPLKTILTDASGRPLNLVTDPNGNQIGPLVGTVAESWLPDTAIDERARAESADLRLGTRTNQISLAGFPVPPLTNVVGWGFQTEVRCTLDSQGIVTFNPPLRGRPVGDEKDGDGTVALKSAAWITGPGVNTFFVPVGIYPTSGVPSPHPRIWDSPPVLQLFDQVLDGRPSEPFICASADHDEARDRSQDVTIRLVASDVTGNPLPNARATLRVNARRIAVDLTGRVRAQVLLKRAGLSANAAADIFRFTIDFEWGVDGRKEVPVLIRV